MGIEIGPVLASGIDPLMPTVVTILLALCLVEIWRSAPRQLMSLASLAAMFAMGWGWLAGSTVLSVLLNVSGARARLGAALVGLALVLLIAAVAAWMRHISPVGNETQARGIMDRIPEMLSREDAYADYLANRKARSASSTVVWIAPIPVAALSVLFVGFLSWALLPAMLTIGAISLYFFLAAIYVVIETNRPPSDARARRNRRTALWFAWIVWVLGMVFVAGAMYISIDEVRWYWLTIFAAGIWTAICISWRDSPLQVAVSTQATAKLRRTILTEWSRLRGAERRLLLTGPNALLRLSTTPVEPSTPPI